MTVQAGPKQELALLAGLADDAIDVAEAALSLALLENPLRDRDRYRALLDGMAAALPAADSAAEQASALALVLAQDHGLIGSEEAPDSPTLMQVLDERRGPAVAIGIIWLAVARRRGWTAEALAFPNHLLVRLADQDGGRTVVDPHGGGVPLGAAELRALLKAFNGNAAELQPAHHAALPARQVLLRLQATVKLNHLRLGRLREAARGVEATLLFAPAEVGLWRELGLMQLRLDDPRAAIAALERYVAEAPASPARNRVRGLLAELRGRPTLV